MTVSFNYCYNLWKTAFFLLQSFGPLNIAEINKVFIFDTIILSFDYKYRFTPSFSVKTKKFRTNEIYLTVDFGLKSLVKLNSREVYTVGRHLSVSTFDSFLSCTYLLESSAIELNGALYFFPWNYTVISGLFTWNQYRVSSGIKQTLWFKFVSQRQNLVRYKRALFKIYRRNLFRFEGMSHLTDRTIRHCFLGKHRVLSGYKGIPLASTIFFSDRIFDSVSSFSLSSFSSFSYLSSILESDRYVISNVGIANKNNNAGLFVLNRLESLVRSVFIFDSGDNLSLIPVSLKTPFVSSYNCMLSSRRFKKRCYFLFFYSFLIWCRKYRFLVKGKKNRVIDSLKKNINFIIITRYQRFLKWLFRFSRKFVFDAPQNKSFVDFVNSTKLHSSSFVHLSLNNFIWYLTNFFRKLNLLRIFPVDKRLFKLYYYRLRGMFFREYFLSSKNKNWKGKRRKEFLVRTPFVFKSKSKKYSLIRRFLFSNSNISVLRLRYISLRFYFKRLLNHFKVVFHFFARHRVLKLNYTLVFLTFFNRLSGLSRKQIFFWLRKWRVPFKLFRVFLFFISLRSQFFILRKLIKKNSLKLSVEHLKIKNTYQYSLNYPLYYQLNSVKIEKVSNVNKSLFEFKNNVDFFFRNTFISVSHFGIGSDNLLNTIHRFCLNDFFQSTFLVVKNSQSYLNRIFVFLRLLRKSISSLDYKYQVFNKFTFKKLFFKNKDYSFLSDDLKSVLAGVFFDKSILDFVNAKVPNKYLQAFFVALSAKRFILLDEMFSSFRLLINLFLGVFLRFNLFSNVLRYVQHIDSIKFNSISFNLLTVYFVSLFKKDIKDDFYFIRLDNPLRLNSSLSARFKLFYNLKFFLIGIFSNSKLNLSVNLGFLQIMNLSYRNLIFTNAYNHSVKTFFDNGFFVKDIILCISTFLQIFKWFEKAFLNLIYITFSIAKTSVLNDFSSFHWHKVCGTFFPFSVLYLKYLSTVFKVNSLNYQFKSFISDDVNRFCPLITSLASASPSSVYFFNKLFFLNVVELKNAQNYLGNLLFIYNSPLILNWFIILLFLQFLNITFIIYSNVSASLNSSKKKVHFGNSLNVLPFCKTSFYLKKFKFSGKRFL